MKRREFIKKSVGAGFVIGSAVTFGDYKNIIGSNFNFLDDTSFDLAAVKGGEPDVMFDRAIDALGGMSKFVKKNQTV
ncbi:MAG: hypothetical protein KAQ90_05335, partial [Melioribacteraceae bacterium]|nr:hypothetical protein [Melioribacteraceae bacterium]